MKKCVSISVSTDEFQCAALMPRFPVNTIPYQHEDNTLLTTPTCSSGTYLATDGNLIAENDEGNCEYKWRLTEVGQTRFEHLVTQMRYRVAEGLGQCVYEIGVADNGTPVGLEDSDYEESIRTIERMAAALNFHFRIAFERDVTAPTISKRREDSFRNHPCGAANNNSTKIEQRAQRRAQQQQIINLVAFKQEKKLLKNTEKKIDHSCIGKKIGLFGDSEAAKSVDASNCNRISLNRYFNPNNRSKTVSGVPKRLRCAELHITKQQVNVKDLLIAFCGIENSGKSTLVGVLTQGALDDGTGKVRSAVVTHKHEVDTGHTSCVTKHVLGFDEEGKVTNYDDISTCTLFDVRQTTSLVSSSGAVDGTEIDKNTCHKRDEEFLRRQIQSGGYKFSSSNLDITGTHSLSAALNATKTIAERSVKLVKLLDLGGHSKYSKTAFFGITSRAPGYACIVVGVDRPVSEGLFQHLSICIAAKIPFFIVLAKCDTISEIELEDVYYDLHDAVTTETKGEVKTKAVEDLNKSAIAEAVSGCIKMTNVPVFPTSCVTGLGIAVLKSFFNMLEIKEPNTELPAEILLDGVAFVVAGVGDVVEGYVAKGTVSIGDELLMGPDRHGNFQPLSIKGIHEKGFHVLTATAGTDATFALGPSKGHSSENLASPIRDNTTINTTNEYNRIFTVIPTTIDPQRKGSVLLARGNVKPCVCKWFECKIKVTQDSIAEHQEPIVHCRNVRQTAKIAQIWSVNEDVIYDMRSITETASPSTPRRLSAHDDGFVLCKFKYHPEVLELGSIILLRCGRHAKGVGTITKLIPFNDETTSPTVRPTPQKSFRWSIDILERVPSCNLGVVSGDVEMTKNIIDKEKSTPQTTASSPCLSTSHDEVFNPTVEQEDIE